MCSISLFHEMRWSFPVPSLPFLFKGLMCKIKTLEYPRASALKALKTPLLQQLGDYQVWNLWNTEKSDQKSLQWLAPWIVMGFFAFVFCLPKLKISWHGSFWLNVDSKNRITLLRLAPQNLTWVFGKRWIAHFPFPLCFILGQEQELCSTMCLDGFGSAYTLASPAPANSEMRVIIVLIPWVCYVHRRLTCKLYLAQ